MELIVSYNDSTYDEAAALLTESDRPHCVVAVDNGEVVGVCTWRIWPTNNRIKRIELAVTLKEEYQDRVLTPSNSLTVAAYNFFNEMVQGNDEYKFYRGVISQVVNPRITPEIMNKFGFFKVGENFYERTFSEA